MLILPSDPEFDRTLVSIKRPDWQQIAQQDGFVAMCAFPGSGGLLTPMTWQQTQDYIEGGAWEERMINELGFSEDELEML